MRRIYLRPGLYAEGPAHYQFLCPSSIACSTPWARPCLPVPTRWRAPWASMPRANPGKRARTSPTPPPPHHALSNSSNLIRHRIPAGSPASPGRLCVDPVAAAVARGHPGPPLRRCGLYPIREIEASISPTRSCSACSGAASPFAPRRPGEGHRSQGDDARRVLQEGAIAAPNPPTPSSAKTPAASPRCGGCPRFAPSKPN